MIPFETVESRLGYQFKTRFLLERAFIHRSFINEHKEFAFENNERLEFLGDSVLNLLIAEYLFHNLPEVAEGTLSSIRASIVSSDACIQYMQQLNLQEFILVGRGEKMQSGKGRQTILADVFEAILGALYLDAGLETTRHVFFFHFQTKIADMSLQPKANFKALLQEYVQKTSHVVPKYHVLEESGPDHKREFLIAVFINEKELGRGRGTTKKEAEQQAAMSAIITICPSLLS
jgi:ribonuclease-3